MYVPVLAGKPLHEWLGIILFILLIFQVLTGKRWVKLPFAYHRGNAMAIVIIALIHALLGLSN